MRQTIFLFLTALLLNSAAVVSQENKSNPMVYKNWQREVRKFTPDFYGTPEAKRIADNVLLYQQTTGGWPKNIYFPTLLTEQQRKDVLAQKGDVNESTIDNNATTVEINYLSNMYNATRQEVYRDAVIQGIKYLLKAQYANGGWPQFYPRPTGYYTQITYNDNAMVNVMWQLRNIAEQKPPFSFLPDSLRALAGKAFDKGIECILSTQVKQGGKYTVWCAQHDKVTLAPCQARAYELPSLSGAESDAIVRLLMSLPNPSQRVIECVEAAVAWFEQAKIEGLQKEYFTNADGKKDYKMVSCESCPALWARFYELDTNRPFFSDRDGVKKYNLSDIGYERRNGYSWYNSGGSQVLSDYAKWKKSH